MFDEKQIKKSMPEATANLFIHGFSDLVHINRWTLVGGTALAIHYQHRLSEDLDFFISDNTLLEEMGHIQSMIKVLQSKGFECFMSFRGNEQIDYEINGVKVTFHSSGLKKLQDNCVSFGNVNIANIDTIIAMKIDVLLHYRIKTRDFYDIKELIEQKTNSLSELLDIYNYSLNKKDFVGEKYILDRFVKNPCSSSDEGLERMKSTGIDSFHELRQWFMQKIEEEAVEDERIIIDIGDSPKKVEEYKESCFGLSRLSLVQKFATLGKNDMVVKCLELSAFDLYYKDLAGKNILYHYENDKEMYKKILQYSHDIPLELMQKDTKFLGKEKLENLQMIQLENSIVNCAKNECNEKRMHINARKFEIDYTEYMQRVNNKRDLFKEIEYKKFVKRNATLSESLEEDDTLLDGLQDDY